MGKTAEKTMRTDRQTKKQTDTPPPGGFLVEGGTRRVRIMGE
jgi:hypothetical protein